MAIAQCNYSGNRFVCASGPQVQERFDLLGSFARPVVASLYTLTGCPIVQARPVDCTEADIFTGTRGDGSGQPKPDIAHSCSDEGC